MGPDAIPPGKTALAFARLFVHKPDFIVLNVGVDTEGQHKMMDLLNRELPRSQDAPSNAVYLFNEMKAACATINERWPAKKPPKNAIPTARISN